MHVLSFENYDVKKADSVFCLSFLFRWVISRSTYYIDGPNDGYPVEVKKLGEIVFRTGD
jgi:hypothetical protein